MKMNVSRKQSQDTDDKKLLYPVRVEYKIMEDFKRTLSKRPWEYLEEGNYEKYLKVTEVKKEPSDHRKELLEVYAEILTLIKDKQRHVNSQFVNPKYDLVKHDFRCICKNTIRFQYYPLPYEVHKPPKDVKPIEVGKTTDLESEFNFKELEFPEIKVPPILKGEKPQYASSRRDSVHSDRDPVVEDYFDVKNVKSSETKLKKKGTKKLDSKEPVKREGTKLVKFDGLSEDSYNKYLDSDRTGSDLPEKYSKLESLKSIALLEHKNTFDAKDLMCMPSLDFEALIEKKQSYKREPKVEPKANVTSPPVKMSSSKKSSGNVNADGDKVNNQEAEMRNDLMHLLESVPVFSDLPKSKLFEISKYFKLKSYFAQSSIILAGEVPQEFFIVASGTVSSYGYEDNTMSSVYKRSYLCSEYFGESFLMDGTASDEFYVADSHVTVQAMSASVFKTVLSGLFDAFRNRLKEFNNYGTYRFNTMTAPSKYFTNMELDKFASGENTVKAKSVLGPKLMEFLNSYPALSEYKNLERLSKIFSYQEYLAKEILVGVCRNDNLFLVYKGTVSLQVYEEELNRQLELVSFGPGSYFFKIKYKSDLVSGFMEKSSFVAKEKVVLLCLEDKYVEKYLSEVVDDMSVHLENLYKSNYLNLEKNKYKLLHSDRSSSSSKTAHSDEQEEQEEKNQEKDSEDSSRTVEEDEELVSNVSLKSEEVVDKTESSSVVSSSSTSVLSSTSREDSSRYTRSSRSDGSGSKPFDDSSRTSAADRYTGDGSDVQSREGTFDKSSSSNKEVDDKVDREQVDDDQKSLTESKESKQFFDTSSLKSKIVSRKSFEDPADVSIRSSLPVQLESSRTVSSIVSSRLDMLRSGGSTTYGVNEVQETDKSLEEENLLSSSLNKLNEVLKTVGVKQTDSGSDKDLDNKSSPSSKSSHSVKSSLASSRDDEDFMDKLMNKIENYKSMLYKSDSDREKSVATGEKEDEVDEEDKSKDFVKSESLKDDNETGVKTVGKVSVDEEDLIRRVTQEDFELIRKNTLLASHVNISDTELSSRSHRSNLLNQGSKVSVISRSLSHKTDRTEEISQESRSLKEMDSARESSIREESSLKESSNVGKDSKDSEVSSVGSDVKFIFNLDALKTDDVKVRAKYAVGLPKLKVQSQVDVKEDLDKQDQEQKEKTDVEQREVEEHENERPDSSRVMGNDNFVDIRNLLPYHPDNLNKMGTVLSMSDMGVAEIYKEMESLLEREMSEMSGKMVYRNTSSSHLLTSRTTNENVLEPEDLSSVARELGDVVEDQVGPPIELPVLNLPSKSEDQEEPNEDKNKDQQKENVKSSIESQRSLSSLDSLISKNYPGVEESLNSVMEVMHTRSHEFKVGRETLTDLDDLYQVPDAHQEKEEYKEDVDGGKEGLNLIKTMGTLDKVGVVEEKELDKSPSLDFAEIPNLTKILSRFHEMYVNPNLPVESVSGSKFSSIDDVYVQLDKIEKLYQSKSFEVKEEVDQTKDNDQEQKVDVDNSRELEKQRTESLFDLNLLYKQSSHTSNNTLNDNIYDSERDEVVPNETQDKVTDLELDKKDEEQFDISFGNLKNKLTNELSIDKLSEQLSIGNLTREFSFDDLTKELSNIGSSISSQISGAFSSKSSEVDQHEVDREKVGDDEKGEDDSGFSFVETSKLIITSIFDNIPLYNSGEQDVEQKENIDGEEKEEEDDGVESKEEVDKQLNVKKEVEELLNKENVLIDKYNLVSRISLDSPSNVTSTSSSDRESLLSKQKEEQEENKDLESVDDYKNLESARSPDASEKDEYNESLLSIERDGREELSLKSSEKVSVVDDEVNEAQETDRSDETFSSLKTSTVKSSLASSRDDVDSNENGESEELVSNVSLKSDSEFPAPLTTGAGYHDESVLTSEKDNESLLSSEVGEKESYVTSEKDTDKYTEKSLVSSLDKSEKNNYMSSISATESINDNSFLSTDSESHLTSSSDSGSYDFKESNVGTDKSLESNQDDLVSVLSSMTSNTENSDLQSKTSDPLESSRLGSVESSENYSRRTSSIDSYYEDEDDKSKTSVPSETESSRRTNSVDSSFDSTDPNEGSNDLKPVQQFSLSEKSEVEDEKDLQGDTDSFSDYDDEQMDEEYQGLEKYKDNEYISSNDFEMLEDTLDSEEEEEEFEYDEETILSIKNLLMSTLKNKYKSLGASFLAMDYERTGKVTCEFFLSFIEKLGIGAIDHREQNLMFDLLKEDDQDYITFASFYKCSGEVVNTLSELNQHFISIFGSSRIAFERFFTTLKKSTRCSQVDFALILNQVGIGEDRANKLFETLDVCKTHSVTVFTMLKMIVGDWDEKVALEYEQKINTNLNRLLTYLSPESLEEFNSEFTRTLSSQFFDQSVEGSLVTDAYEEFYIERDLKYFDQLSTLLSEQKEFAGISLAQKRFIVSLFNVIDTSSTPHEAFMCDSEQGDEQKIFLVSSKEVEAPLVALISGTLDMDFEGITYPKHLNLTVPCLPNYYQFVSSLEKFYNQGYLPGYGESPQSSMDFSQLKPECGYSLSFNLSPDKDTVVALMPLASYLYNVIPLLVERNKRLPVMLQFLKSVPSFNVYTPEELDKIVSACTVRQFKLHETVIRTGETPTHFYLVFDGSLTVTNEYNFEFKIVGKNEFFSSYDLVNNQANNFTLIANCSLVLLSWERNEFFRVFNKYSTLVENDACNLNDFENLGLQKLVDKKVSFAE